ncbi:GNAT family N-acetyltransferase [Plantactinospora sp. KBS50]|uniref:GNAT family N-acetyltransferase n=1 Tax=Plantactinospora sp. KBS50 TaxID=2024580 RepID=UPI000BAAA389|nr:GNAT family N-acetyltransferase [Plantactinospora sp. KBS50]ASW54792.1 GNAT family N-acetyltransferase [Plantactinospora sp. KBS50]
MIQLRPARPVDAGAIAEVWAAGWRDGHLGHVPEELVAARTPESFRPRAADRIDSTTVAEVDGALAGFVTVVADEVEQVYVAAAHRGSGLAGRLLAEAEHQVAGAGHGGAWLAVVAGNARARRFYETSGWRDDGPYDYAAEHDGATITVPCRRYRKELPAQP